MATITVNGVAVELRSKESVLEVINDMITEATESIKSGTIKGNAQRKQETSTASFFGSIKHYLEGGIEV